MSEPMVIPPESSHSRRVMEQDHRERRVKRKAEVLTALPLPNFLETSYMEIFEHYKRYWKRDSKHNVACERFMDGTQVVRNDLPDQDKPAIDYFFANYRLEPDEMTVEFKEDGTFNISNEKEFYFVTAHIKRIQTTGGTAAYATKISEGLYVKKVYVQSRTATSGSFMNKYEFYFYDKETEDIKKLPCAVYSSKFFKSKQPVQMCTAVPLIQISPEDLPSASVVKTFSSTEAQTEISIGINLDASESDIKALISASGAQ
jgi:hypothetical protein